MANPDAQGRLKPSSVENDPQPAAPFGLNRSGSLAPW